MGAPSAAPWSLTLVAAAALAFRPTTPIDVSVTPTAIVSAADHVRHVCTGHARLDSSCQPLQCPPPPRRRAHPNRCPGRGRFSQATDARPASSTGRPVSPSISKATSTSPSSSTIAFRSYLPAASPWRSGARTATSQASSAIRPDHASTPTATSTSWSAGNNRIQKLAPDGRPLAQWGGSGQLNGPLGVALDTQGNVYVADSGNNRIQKFSSSGQIVAAMGRLRQWPRPVHVTLRHRRRRPGQHVCGRSRQRPNSEAGAGWPAARTVGHQQLLVADDAKQLTFSGPDRDRAGFRRQSAGNRHRRQSHRQALHQRRRAGGVGRLGRRSGRIRDRRSASPWTRKATSSWPTTTTTASRSWHRWQTR